MHFCGLDVLLHIKNRKSQVRKKLGLGQKVFGEGKTFFFLSSSTLKQQMLLWFRAAKAHCYAALNTHREIILCILKQEDKISILD